MKKIKNILILAGGDSTRFWPLKNKIIWPFLGVPLISYLINQLSQYAEKLTVVVNKENDKEIRSFSEKKIEIVVQDPNLQGMGGAVLSCADKIKGETLIVNASDIFSPTLIENLIKETNKGKMILVGRKIDRYFPGGFFKFSQGKLLGIVEKPPVDKLPSDLIRLVADYFVDFNLFVDSLKKTRAKNDDHYEQALNYLLNKKIKTAVIVYNDYWLPLKYPWQVLPMTSFFLKQIKQKNIHRSSKISSKAIVVPPVYLGRNVYVGDFAKVVGPCYVGDNTVIADHTLVCQSHIGQRCLIGGYSEVTRSYICNGVMIHRNYIGDSVIAEFVLMGAGAATANFRFDGKPIKDSGLIKLGAVIGSRSKIGVNATILPGIKIGSNTFVGPAEVVDQDIGDNQFIFKNRRLKNRVKIK